MILSVIIPTYNEQEVIEESYRRMAAVMQNLVLKDWEFLFVNDGSRDRTLEILRHLAASDQRVRVLNFSRNFGHQAAVTAGLRECRGDAAVIIDADLQDPPEVIPEMLKIMQDEQCDVVYGVRVKRKGETWFKKWTARLYYRLINYLSDIRFPNDTGDFRLVSRRIIDVFNRMPEKNKYIRGLISWVGFRQCPVYYEREPRFAGETKYPLRKMLRFAAIGVFYFSKKPLKLATNIGFLSILIGLLLAVYLTIGVFLGFARVIAGWTSTIVIIVFFGGVQLLTIGVLGQYIGSLFDEVKNRPDYIIEEEINPPKGL